jgi:LPXTG-motif cell wall-anchored protein
MNLAYNDIGQLGTALSRPDPKSLLDRAYASIIENFTASLPNPRGYYFQEVFEKDVVKAEKTRNKEILSSSSFNSGVTVGRGSQAGEIYYRNDAAMRSYAIPYDKKYVESITKAMARISEKLKKANYKQLPNGSWVEKSGVLFRQPNKTGMQAKPGTISFSPGASLAPQDEAVTPAGRAFTPSPDGMSPLPIPQIPTLKAEKPPTPWVLYLGVAAVIGGGAFFLLRRRK